MASATAVSSTSAPARGRSRPMLRGRALLPALLLALALAPGLGGCGFQLRGSGPGGLPALFLEGGNPGAGLRLELDRILRGSGELQAQSRDQARGVLRLTQENYDRRPLSISTQLTVQEYELIYTVGFQVMSPAGEALAPPQVLSFTRDYSFANTVQVLGKGNEEELLRQEMIRDASRQVLAQTLAVLRR